MAAYLYKTSGWQRFLIFSILLLPVPRLVASRPPALDQDSPWPRKRSVDGATVTLHLPQVERWTSNWFSARAVVEVKSPKEKIDSMGVVWFEAHGTVDRSNRVVTLERMEITKGNFPDTKDEGRGALAIVRKIVP